MNAFARIWRRVRWLLILLCLGSAVIAAEGNWFNSLRVGEMSLLDWLERLAGDPPVAKPILAPERATVAPVEPSTNAWLNTALFSQPSAGWTLTKTSNAMIQPASASTSAETNPLPTALFSSGFVSYSPATIGPVPNAATFTSGTWSANTGSASWGSSSSWSGGFVADGAGATAHFDALDITTDVTVVLDGSRTIGFLQIGDVNGTNHYNITPLTGSFLIFDTGAMTHADLSQTAGSAGDTITAPILFKSELNINNFSTTKEFTIAGSIASNAVNNFRTISFNPSISGNAGLIRVTGAISNGSTGTVVGVEVTNGTVIFSGSNSYTGATIVSGGTLLVNGNQTNATGLVEVFGSGSVLGGTGTIGGTAVIDSGTITGGTTTGVGTLTLLKNLTLDTHEGSGGTYLANLANTISDLLAITGTLSLGTNSTLELQGTVDNIHTYVLATFNSLDPSNDRFGAITGIGVPAGYTLVYNANDIELVPTGIPEPATWIGGALGLGAVVLAARRRLHRL